MIDRPVEQILKHMEPQCESIHNACKWDDQELEQQLFMAKMRNGRDELLDLSIAVIPVIIDETHVGSHILIKDITEETQRCKIHLQGCIIGASWMKCWRTRYIFARKTKPDLL